MKTNIGSISKTNESERAQNTIGCFRISFNAKLILSPCSSLFCTWYRQFRALHLSREEESKYLYASSPNPMTLHPQPGHTDVSDVQPSNARLPVHSQSKLSPKKSVATFITVRFQAILQCKITSPGCEPAQKDHTIMGWKKEKETAPKKFCFGCRETWRHEASSHWASSNWCRL